VIVDRLTGQVRPAQIFVDVMGASNFTHAEASWTQALADWVGAHTLAFAALGGVPKLLVPDNTKVALIKACLYEPQVNRTLHRDGGPLPSGARSVRCRRGLRPHDQSDNRRRPGSRHSPPRHRAALYEEVIYDAAGQLLTASLADYAIPTASEMPSTTTVHLVEAESASTVGGFRGMGEGGTIGAPAAVANALADALAPLGAEIFELPMTPERLFRLIERSRRERNVRSTGA
jgi:hypothetical protein